MCLWSIWLKKSIHGPFIQGCNRNLHFLQYLGQITVNFKTDDIIINLMTTINFSVSKTMQTLLVGELLQIIKNQCFLMWPKSTTQEWTCPSPHLVGSSTADESRAYEERDFEINVEQTQYDAEDFAVLTKLNFIIFWKLLIDKKKKVSLCVWCLAAII